jgi:DNA-binding MarR family transcriptional regulator
MPAKHELIQRIFEELRGYQRANDVIDELTTERAGVNRTDGRCIDILEERGPMTAGTLAVQTGLTTGAITAAVDRLERVGLAQRVADARDRRKVMVGLTDKARGMCEAIYGPITSRGLAIMQRYTIPELEVILDFLERARRLLETRGDQVRGEIQHV